MGELKLRRYPPKVTVDLDAQTFWIDDGLFVRRLTFQECRNQCARLASWLGHSPLLAPSPAAQAVNEGTFPEGEALFRLHGELRREAYLACGKQLCPAELNPWLHGYEGMRVEVQCPYPELPTRFHVQRSGGWLPVSVGKSRSNAKHWVRIPADWDFGNVWVVGRSEA